MPIRFVCEGCGKRYRVEDSAAGKSGKCKECGHTVTIPAQSTQIKPVAGPAIEVEERPTPAGMLGSGKEPNSGTRQRRIPRVVLVAGLLIGITLVGVYMA